MNESVFRASFANEKLKQDTQTQVADDIQVMSVLCVTQLEIASRNEYVPWEGKWRGFEPPANGVSAECLAIQLTTPWQRNLFEISGCLHPVKFS